MGVKSSASRNAIDAYFRKVIEIYRKEMVSAFAYIGEKALTRARDRSQDISWIDHTGNLRSSIGYSVIEMGRQMVISDFAIIMKGNEGAHIGRNMIEEIAQSYANTYALIVVAGMNYADLVEARDNKDVLASAELYARGLVDSYLDKTRQKIIRRINAIKI